MEDSLKEIRKALYEQRKAFDAHIAPERERLWGYCRRLTGSTWDGEDLVQETLIRAFGGLTRYWSPISPKAYLFRIATRLWIDRHQRGTLDEIPLLEQDAATEDESLSEEGHAAIELMVATLPPRQRVVFLLTQAFEFTASEVGEMLEITEGAVKASLHRARRSLSSPPAAAPSETAIPDVLRQFVDAFNKKDIDALCSLFREDVSIDIVGMAEEHGRDQLKGSSVKYTIEDEDADEALVFRFQEEPVVLLLKHLANGEKALSEVIRVTECGGEVVSMRTYYFCPQVLAEVADAYGVAAFPHGYHLRQ